MDYLVRKIRYLIEEEAKKINKNEPIFEERFFELVTDIEDKLLHGEDWLTQTKEEGFTVNTAEAEGYVRALREVKAYIDFLKDLDEETKAI